MVMQLLPASAKAFASRSGPNVVLGQRAELWLTHTLKRINKNKRPLNNVSQHKKVLEEILSGDEAIWSLASISIPKFPATDFQTDDDPIVESLQNYNMLHIEGYVVHVDMVSQREVAFKLTKASIEALTLYHKTVFSVDSAAQFEHDWPDKPKHVEKLQEDFVQAINSYVYRAKERCLEGLEEEGTGELLEGRSEDVKIAINALFKQLQPPPPKIIDVIGPPMMVGNWIQSYYVQQGGYQYQAYYPQIYAPPQQYYQRSSSEPFPILHSTPSPSPSRHSEVAQPRSWSTTSQPAQPAYSEPHLPSPAPSFSQPYTSSTQYSSLPAWTPPVESLPFPSQLASGQCGSSVSSAYGNFYGYNDMPLTPQFAF